MGRAPCCEKVGLKKGRWTAEEDEILTKYIQVNGEGSWRSLPKNAGLLRCGKSCRLRWVNYLKDNLKRGTFSSDEEEILVKLHASLGNRWSLIASHLPGRTDNDIKNYWNAHLSRKFVTFRSPRPTIVKVASCTMKKVESCIRENGDVSTQSVSVDNNGDVPTRSPEENVPVDDGNGNASAERPEENVPVDDGDGSASVERPEDDVPIDDGNGNASAERLEENVLPVDDGNNNVYVERLEEDVPLPATPTQEKETLPINVLEGYMELDIFAEEKHPIASSPNCQEICPSDQETTINNSMLCPRSEEKETQIFGPFEDINSEMLCFNDNIDNVPLDLNEIWSLLDQETENCVTNISDKKEIGALSEGLDSAHLSTSTVACSSTTSFFEDNSIDWDWESVVQGAYDQHSAM